MKIDEVAGQFAMLELPGHTRLFHGTNSGDFMVPDGPAWFAFTPEKAQQWIGWAGLTPGRKAGAARVLVFETYKALSLVDTREESAWRAFCQSLTGDPEIGTGVMAQAVKKYGLAGWYGREEVMISEPIAVLYPRGVHNPNGA
jgi:hypothetical protein